MQGGAALHEEALQRLLAVLQPRQQPHRNIGAVPQRLPEAPVPQQPQPQVLQGPACRGRL